MKTKKIVKRTKKILRVKEPVSTYKPKAQHDFGGKWTCEKLERVRKYLTAYTTALKSQPFELAYIDAFAGTGYRTLQVAGNTTELMFPELAVKESQEYLEGSARLALNVEPRFGKYIFIEREGKHIVELESLKTDYTHLAKDITVVNDEANNYLKQLCKKNWKGHRAVLFLDPYGMQVNWGTLEAIANTKAIDIWILFPLCVAVNRLLKRDGKINNTVKVSLDKMFGTDDWYDSFYEETTTEDLFGKQTKVSKVSTFPIISAYFIDRLKTIFAGVAPNPLPLYNSRGNPLYLLCFAASNEKGAKTAIRIAQNILKR